MKKFFHYILMAAFIGGTIPFSSCNDDDENQLNEWNMSYVSLLPADYLRPIPSFTLKHIIDKGIEGSVEFQVMATLQKPASQDVSVNIDATCDGIAADKIVKSSDAAIIKAGNLKSEPVTISITDWSDIESVEEAAEYTLNIKVKDIVTGAVEVANSEFNQSVAVKIVKEQAKMEEFLFFNQVPENSTLYTNATDWDFSFMDGVENAGSNSVAGTGGNNVATNGVPFWVSVDFKEVKKLTGIKTSHWSPVYAPSKVEILTSDNGSTWKSWGEVQTSGSYQTIAFKNVIETRYLKYQMVTVPGRVDITKLHVYMSNN